MTRIYSLLPDDADVFEDSLSVDGQGGNMSGIAVTHQPSACVSPGLKSTLSALRQIIKYLYGAG